MGRNRWDNYADLFAFVGNSLLNPISRTEKMGLDPEFWNNFPDLGDKDVKRAINCCMHYAITAQERSNSGEDVVQGVSVEYTKLFVGPPSPAAPPWETFNCEDGVSTGYGQPAFEMHKILSNMGLGVSNSNNQYPDHMGIELLVLSEMLRRISSDITDESEVFEYLSAHPKSWIGVFRSKVVSVFPDGYYANLLALGESVLNQTANELKR